MSTFSNLSGERLQQIYSKLKQEQQVSGVGPSQMNGSTSGFINKGFDTEKFEAWKRRKRAESDAHSQFQPHYQRPITNGVRIPEPNSSSGILGAAPNNGRPFRMNQSGFSQRQGFSSGIK